MKCICCHSTFEHPSRGMIGLSEICTPCDIYLCHNMDFGINVSFDKYEVKVSGVKEAIFDPNDTDKVYPIMPSNIDIDRVYNTIMQLRLRS